MRGGELTRHLQSLMPAEKHVYGGAARVYAVGFSESAPHFAAMPRFVHSSIEAIKAADRLSSDIWAAANAAGLLPKPGVTAKEMQGTVLSIYGDASVAIKLNNGDLTTIRQAATFPDVPMSWLFKVGQTIRGLYDAEARIFEIDRPGSTVEEIIAAVGLGNVTFGLVRSTDRKTAKIALHPDVEFDLRKDEVTGNQWDTVDGYLGVGDVVPVRIYRDPQGRVRLRMDDIDDDEVVYPALILVEGGEPWLVEGRVLFEPIEDNFVDTAGLTRGSGELLDESEYVQETAEPSPTPGPVVASPKPRLNTQERNHENAVAHYRGIIATGNKRIEELNDHIDELSRLLDGAQAQLLVRNEEVVKLRPLAALARKTRVSNDRSGSTAYARQKRFATLEEWFREEVRRAWFKDFTPSERKQFVLTNDDWGFGENLLPRLKVSLVDDNELRKLIRAVIFLVTGRNAVEHLNEAHPLKENDKPMLLGGEPVMRMHIENGNPQAMRLHYLKKRDGSITLLKVVKHDDFTI